MVLPLLLAAGALANSGGGGGGGGSAASSDMDTQRQLDDLDYLERQKASEYAPLGVNLGSPPTAGFPMLPNGAPAPYGGAPVAPYGVEPAVGGAAPIPPPAAPPPAAPFGVGMGENGVGAIGSQQAPIDQGVTPDMAHTAANKVLPNGQPAPFYVDDGGGQPEIGPMGQAMQGYTPPVQPAMPGAAPVMPGWHSPSPQDMAALPSNLPVDNWFGSLTPEEQRMVGGPEAARPRGGPLQGGGGISMYGGDTEGEIARIRQQYEQAIRGNYR